MGLSLWQKIDCLIAELNSFKSIKVGEIDGFELIPQSALEAMAAAFKHGLTKENRKAGDWKKCTLDEVQDKIDRHLSALYDGIEYDSEGNSHLGAVLADVAIYGELLNELSEFTEKEIREAVE